MHVPLEDPAFILILDLQCLDKPINNNLLVVTGILIFTGVLQYYFLVFFLPVVL